MNRFLESRWMTLAVMGLALLLVSAGLYGWNEVLLHSTVPWWAWMLDR
jgi:hypothetical protein